MIISFLIYWPKIKVQETVKGIILSKSLKTSSWPKNHLQSESSGYYSIATNPQLIFYVVYSKFFSIFFTYPHRFRLSIYKYRNEIEFQNACLLVSPLWIQLHHRSSFKKHFRNKNQKSQLDSAMTHNICLFPKKRYALNVNKIHVEFKHLLRIHVCTQLCKLDVSFHNNSHLT